MSEPAAVGPFLPGPNDTPEYGLYPGECSALMAQMPAESVDMALTSPPYDNLRRYHGYTFDFEAIAAQLWRVIRPGGVVVWVVADATVDGSETGTSFRQALYFVSLGFSMETMIYEVAGTGAKGSNNYYWQGFEYMFVFCKGKPTNRNLIKDKQNTTANQTTRGERMTVDGRRKDSKLRLVPKQSTRTNIWRYTWGFNSGNNTGHPAVFPEALARDHILSWSNPGDLIFDPMCGSGTTAKAAKMLQRRWLGFDISPGYVDLARRRVRDYTNPPLPLVIEQPVKVKQATLLSTPAAAPVGD